MGYCPTGLDQVAGCEVIETRLSPDLYAAVVTGSVLHHVVSESRGRSYYKDV